MADNDMTELGTSGLEAWGGMIFEEKLKQLSPERSKLVYREMEDNDATIGGVLRAIDMLIRQIEWRMTPASEDAEDVELAEFYWSCLNDMEQTWTETVSEILSMLTFGFAPMEVVMKVRGGLDTETPSQHTDGRIGWKKFGLRAQETIQRWDIDPNGYVRGLYQMAPPSYKSIYIPIEKLLLFKTSSRKNNPEGRSILRTAWRSWYFKKRIENIEAVGIERDLAGLPVALVPPEIMSKNATPDQQAIRANIKKIITNIRRDEQEGVIFPNMYDDAGHKLYELTLLTTGGRRNFDTSAIIGRYKQDMAMSMLADFILLGHEQVGSFALASSKTNIFTTCLVAWVKMITEVINKKGIPQLAAVNGHDRTRLPQLTFGDIETVDLNELSVYLSALTGAGVDLTGEKAQAYLKGQANIPLDTTEGV